MVCWHYKTVQLNHRPTTEASSRQVCVIALRAQNRRLLRGKSTTSYCGGGTMKALFLLLVAAVLYVQCNGQFSGMCLPQPMREVPVTLQIRKAPPDLSACGDDGRLAIPELEALAEERIISQYQHAPNCRLVSVEHTSCRVIGSRRQRVILHYVANLTCGNECYHLGLHDWRNRNANRFYDNQVVHLRDAYKTQPRSNFSYNDKLVEIFYFRGPKGDFHFMCGGDMIQNGVNKKIPACRCPSSCTDPCELPSETGRCRGYFPSYYHNATSGQCEEFIYGGCGGNQNRFSSQDVCEKACKVCPEGMVYQECGTACPATCDNKAELIICTLQCVQGCFCEEGTILLEEDGEVCVASKDCPVTEPEQECPVGKVYNECGTACPLNCDNKDDLTICTQQCVPGCFCPDGYVEQGDHCVLPGECDIDICSLPPEAGLCYAYFPRYFYNSTSGECEQFIYGGCLGNSNNFGTVELCESTCKECPEGMVYQECGTACPTTCDNKDDLIQPCTLQCVQGCFCNGSTILLEEDGDVCVAPKDCPEQECPEGKVYNECGTACPLNCDNKDEVIICTKQCVPGCFCPNGSVEMGDLCVLPEECDLDICSLPPETGPCETYFLRFFHNSTSGECESFVYGGCQGNSNNFNTIEQCESMCIVNATECPEGMVYTECGTGCPTTCDNKFDQVGLCTLQCVPGCFCKEGTILLEEDGDVCVAPKDCPMEPEQECPEGMVYQECGTACPTTCDNKDDLIHICTLQCVQGCFCNGSTVLLNENSTECVVPENCPVEPPEQECPVGKVYQECGTACPLNCDNKDMNITCTTQCVADCFCPTGYVEKGDHCVFPEECDLDICSLLPETGPCRGSFSRFFYNSTSEECEQFTYGGCQGNSNNFGTIEQCESTCKECPEGMVYEKCGTACPTTCDNKDDLPQPCTLQCVQGCFCSEGTILLEAGVQKCVANDECPTTQGS